MPFLKNLGLVASSCALLLGAARAAAEAPKVYADVEVKLTDAALQKKSAGIRTLFITLYDEASPAPMPYGAMKVQLTQDAQGTVYKGKLDTANVMVMGAGGEPKSLRIKAKLDKNGAAGADAAGDIVGNATGVKVGSTVTITINEAI